jgi:hypothetical protein
MGQCVNVVISKSGSRDQEKLSTISMELSAFDQA